MSEIITSNSDVIQMYFMAIIKLFLCKHESYRLKDVLNIPFSCIQSLSLCNYGKLMWFYIIGCQPFFCLHYLHVFELQTIRHISAFACFYSKFLLVLWSAVLLILLFSTIVKFKSMLSEFIKPCY